MPSEIGIFSLAMEKAIKDGIVAETVEVFGVGFMPHIRFTPRERSFIRQRGTPIQGYGGREDGVETCFGLARVVAMATINGTGGPSMDFLTLLRV